MTCSKVIALTAILIALGAVTRIGIGSVVMIVPPPLYGVLIAVGLSETLTFISGFAFGSVAGFVTGCSIIIISDLATLPGPWTPFIAVIIGLIGIVAGILRRFTKEATFRMMGISAVSLTLMSETLQNAWVALAFNMPFWLTMFTGLPTLAAALVNNFVLFTTVGLRAISVISGASINSKSKKSVSNSIPGGNSLDIHPS